MSEVEDKTNDLCPMCKGSGKHDLQAPNKRVYELVVMNPSRTVVDGIAMTQVDTNSFLTHVNRFASTGYELMNVVTPPGGAMVAVLKWRWL